MNTKYVRLKEYNTVIVFPEILNHSDFEKFDVVSAGFCHIHSDKITCFGKSISLNLQSNELDTYYATKSILGPDIASELPLELKP